jgi:hypothetical protein
MLDQLWSLWKAFEAEGWPSRKLALEVSIWLEQHSVDADDFAFSLGCSLARYAGALS